MQGKGDSMENKLRKMGNIEQVASIRSVEYKEGPAQGLNAYQVKNGPLQFSVAADKGLDILELSYKGTNISFLSKNGLTSGAYTRGYAYSDKGVMGGMFFTCGPDNVGPGDKERQLPIHGSMRFTSAHNRSARCFYDEEGRYHMQVSGVMEPYGLFEGHIRLERTIETFYGESKVRITDRYVNEGYVKMPLMVLYHCNFAYPFLDTNCQLKFSSSSVVLREAMDKETDLAYNQIDEPVDGGVEEVFFHEAVAGADGTVSVSVYNPELDIQAKLTYSKAELPRLVQWKSMVSGDYVLGIEPANCLVFGRAYEEEHGTLEYLEPGQEKMIHLEFEFI